MPNKANLQSALQNIMSNFTVDEVIQALIDYTGAERILKAIGKEANVPMTVEAAIEFWKSGFHVEVNDGKVSNIGKEKAA